MNPKPQTVLLAASSVPATNGVMVNSQTAWRKAEYFWAAVKSNNTASAQSEGITVSSGGTTNIGNLFAPKTPEVFKYDADGNLTNDGRWTYVWDAENRLIQMTVNTNVGPQYQLTFAYDAKGRRIQKMVTSNSVAIYTNKFVYDGWNLVAELKPDNNPIRTYVWGSDVSGSLQGAGGVGGLLEVSYGTTNCFPAYDGNGNVMALINAADGTSLANYAYGPFGELVQKTGLMANNNPFRFSTKYQDDESDLLYYGYRYYKPSTGTWMSRDPLGEESSLKLLVKGKKKTAQQQLRWEGLQPAYLFVRNSPQDYRDILGLALGNPMCGAYGCTFEPAPPSPCEKAIMDAKNDLGNVNNDKRAHCIHSCEIAKACGKRVCKCLGTLKEARDLSAGAVEWTCSWVLPKAAEDWLHDNIQGGNVDDSAGDFAANDWGMSVAATKGDCVKECEARYGRE